MKKVIFLILIGFILIFYLPKTKSYSEIRQSINQVKSVYYENKQSINEVKQFMSTAPKALDQFDANIKELEKIDNESTRELNNLNKQNQN
ncbi:hypothetical protein [Clostridium thailandense]|uniref:hypothetical protein n=1 Tax=Clostridium thailandense TaxID=2794346 RepID=UPI00398A4ACE